MPKPDTENKDPKTYRFPVCLICQQEIDESNEHRHQGPLHDVQTLPMLPLQVIRERLEGLLLSVERQGDNADSPTARTVCRVKADGIRAALAAFPEQEER